MAANLKPESWRHKKIVELAEYQKNSFSRISKKVEMAELGTD